MDEYTWFGIALGCVAAVFYGIGFLAGRAAERKGRTYFEDEDDVELL